MVGGPAPESCKGKRLSWGGGPGGHPTRCGREAAHLALQSPAGSRAEQWAGRQAQRIWGQIKETRDGARLGWRETDWGRAAKGGSAAREVEAGRERVGRQRAMGGQSEQRSGLGSEGLECRELSGRRKDWRQRERTEGRWGRRGGGGHAARGKRTRGADGEKKRLGPRQRRSGTPRRGAAAWRSAQWLSASIQALESDLCLTLRVGNRRAVLVESCAQPREWGCSGLGPGPGARRGFPGPGLDPKGSGRRAWKSGQRKEGRDHRPEPARRGLQGCLPRAVSGGRRRPGRRLPGKWRRMARIESLPGAAEGPSFRQG